MAPPRVFLIRHGETDWSKRELHTGVTDVLLTERGEQQARETSHACVGEGKLIDPKRIAHIYASPRRRALQTVKLLDLGVNDRLPSNVVLSFTSDARLEHRRTHAFFSINEELREWDYGDYEGMTVQDVWQERQERGLDKDGRRWNIFVDGCEVGESAEQVTQRVDSFLTQVRDTIKAKQAGGANGEASDIVCVAHGHILSAIAVRWTGRPLQDGVRLLIDTGGIAVLSYEHHALDEPAIVIGPKP
ncbi:uncharacterized protein PV07_04190 [Cladophialophora immunda]|uniref:Phosphoglycerate mutase n=1 Tax=Cladophialophora immunda TaxID=569365 RepID=A0A0D1ZWX5_9EURO|nr:uncharacterized protein PV07_04190 [Cladophialophora immunda]KIW32661.1 hypothetical protein PV07_04190 [Cladophialophora immunda]OQV03536.1 hypothetical protein CLAIMM_08571 isoform 1 [Cladophialophora immunda]OQV03537.1 hypothetical protein CLAIMM_08571 isoform 2 [Cladophialophora immunda]